MEKLNIKIKNYRSLIDVNLSINVNSPRLIAIVGENNVGKTSLLNVIKKVSINSRFIKDDKTSYKEGGISLSQPSIDVSCLFQDNENDFEYLVKTGINESNISERISFPEEFKTKLELKMKSKLEELENTNYKSTGAYIMDSNTPWWTFAHKPRYDKFLETIKKSEDEKIISIVYEIRKLYIQKLNTHETKLKIKYFSNEDIFKFTTLKLGLLLDESVSDPNSLQQIYMIKIWEKILDVDFKEWLLFRENPNEPNTSLPMFSGVVPKNKQMTPRDVQEYLKNFELKCNNLIKQISDKIGADFQNEINITFDSSNNLFINFNVKNTKDNVNQNKFIWNNDAGLSGDGIKAFYSLIFQLNSIQKNEFTIILIDEPEQHLNPIYQNYLLSVIRNFSIDKNRINQVIIYSTHSPFMIKMEMYQNLFCLRRDKTDNATIMTPIYKTKGLGVPSGFLDKHIELRFLEANLQALKPEQVIFVEGIADFNVINNIIKKDKNVFIIPLFGAAYLKSAVYHVPYVESFNKNYKLIVDDDDTGNGIIKWFTKNTNIIEQNIKKYSDFYPHSKDLEESIIDPWFEKTEIEKTPDKKVNSIIFSNKNKDEYPDVFDFIYSKKEN